MDETLTPVSPNLIKVRYLARIPWCIIATGGAVVWARYFDDKYWGIHWGYYLAIIAGIFLLWQIWLIPRQVYRLGWLETDNDLLLSKGKLWHTFTVVPYGRVQYLDVSQGPIERRYGLKTLRLHTASASVDAKIPGLDADLADELRARIARRAKENMIDL